MSTKEKSKGGRPLKYTCPETMQADIDGYFADCVANDKPPTISGLAYHLNMTTESLRNYEAREQFSAVVNRAKQRVEISLEERLYQGSPVGAIFNLKNNFGWKDKSEMEVGVTDRTAELVAARKRLEASR